MLAKISFPGVPALLAACSLLVGALMAQTDLDPSAIEKLQELTLDEDPLIRAAVVSLLAEISSTVTLPALERLLQDPDSDVRERAKAAINAIRGR